MKSLTAYTALCVAILSLSLGGCGGGHDNNNIEVPCTGIVIPGVIVYVFDTNGKTPSAEDTHVTITDGEYTETLQPDGIVEGDQDSLDYRGALGRPGTYTVTVTHTGDTTITRTVTATKGECHVNTQFVNVTLTPE